MILLQIKLDLRKWAFPLMIIKEAIIPSMKLKKLGFDVKKIAPLLESDEDLQDRKDTLEKQCLEVSVTIREQHEFQEKCRKIIGGTIR